MKKRKRSRSGSPLPEARRREIGSPLAVTVRYPQDVLSAIDAARGDTSRSAWLLAVARAALGVSS